MRESTLNDYQQRILRVLLHIQDNLDEALKLEELAALAHFSPYHFHRVFRGMVGESLAEHLRRIRLERAAARLKLGEDNVTHQAFDAGYESLEAFSRAFRRRFGVAPSDFRSRRAVARAEASPSGVHYPADGEDLSFQPLESDGARMDVKIETRDAQRVAFVRHVGPYQECGKAWQALCERLGPEGRLGPNSQFIGISHDDPDVTPADKLRYDACVPVDESFEAAGEVGVQTVNGGPYAVAMHEGPYERLSETYAHLLGQWLPGQERKLQNSPCLEVYLNDAKTTPPEKLLTAVCVPLLAED